MTRITHMPIHCEWVEHLYFDYPYGYSISVDILVNGDAHYMVVNCKYQAMDDDPMCIAFRIYTW